MISVNSMRMLAALLLPLLLFVPSVFAQEASPSSTTVDLPSQTTVNYALPYPGILPDNPLYSVKMLRDKIVLFLITDPYKKAKFNLLQADKRLQAGLYLLDKRNGKEELALSTIEKGENYFLQSVEQVAAMVHDGHEVGSLIGDLKQAAAKHHEVLTQLQSELPQKKSQLSLLLKRNETYQKQLLQLEKK